MNTKSTLMVVVVLVLLLVACSPKPGVYTFSYVPEALADGGVKFDVSGLPQESTVCMEWMVELASDKICAQADEKGKATIVLPKPTEIILDQYFTLEPKGAYAPIKCVRTGEQFDVECVDKNTNS